MIRRKSGEKPLEEPASGHLKSAFEDPLSALPETARNLLLAAKTVVATEGFEALTLSAVAKAAGENTALIAYYFGNKAGLVATVLDSVIHDEYIASQNRMKGVTSPELTEHLVNEMQMLDEAREDFRVFFELLPHTVSDATLRRQMKQLYTWYWSEKLDWMGFKDSSQALQDQDMRGLAQLLSAVLDGLAIQAAIDPDLDLSNPYRVLRRFLDGTSLAALLEEGFSRCEPGTADGDP